MHFPIRGSRDYLENFHTTEGDPIYSTAQISLQFSVKSDFERISPDQEGTSLEKLIN